MAIAFDPQRRTPHVSMNRVKIVDLPGLNLPDDIKGKTGYQLLSSQALVEHIRPHAEELHYPPELDTSKLPIALDGCLVSDNPNVRAAAERIARQFGRNLGYLLLTLKRGDPANRAARAEWDDSYWDYWGKIETVWLGGGLVSGNLGKHLQTHALAVFLEAGISDFNLYVSPYGAALPMVGAARHAPRGSAGALVFDFGGTFIKRGVAKYSDDTLVEFQRLPSVPAEVTEGEMEPQTFARHLFDHMAQVIVETWESPGLAVNVILASIACYLEDGHPQNYQGGGYVRTRLITDNLQRSLTEAVSERLNTPITLRLLHDGTAAATTYAGSPRSAVLMMGTALGLGFPPPSDEGLCRLGEIGGF